MRAVVVCEDAPDLRLGTRLADRVATDEAQVCTQDQLDERRVWRGLDENEGFLKWSTVRERAKKAGVRVLGTFDGVPAEPDAKMARKALQLIERSGIAPELVLLLRDTDGKDKRSEGFRQAIATKVGRFTVVAGLPHTKRECWLLAGFVPSNPDETAKLDGLEKRLGFDPTVRSDQLKAASYGPAVKRNAKTAWEELASGVPDLAERCAEADLALLRERGRLNGLGEYLDAVREGYVPLLRDATG